MASPRKKLALALVVVALLGIVGVFAVVRLTSPPPLTPAERAAIAARAAARRLLHEEQADVAVARGLLSVSLPASVGAPAPDPPSSLFASPLAPREVMGFVPYWLVGAVTAGDLQAASDVVYSSLCVGPSGALSLVGTDCSRGDATFASPSFARLLGAAHAAGDRVLLSLSSFSDADIAQLLRHPDQTAARVVAWAAPLVRADGLDGVNLDIEGSRPEESGAYVRFVAAFTEAFRSLEPHDLVVLDTYAASASSAPGFFHVAKLAPLVDRLFIEGYQMDDPAHATPNAPIASPHLGYSAVQSMIEYEHVAPAAKLIFGVAFYGLDFTTKGPRPGADATAPSPESFTYQAIVASGRTPLWDPVSETPYAAFRRDGSWHQLWFDNPVSIALKVALAASLHLGGVGAWAFGMDGGDPALLGALTGGAPALKPLGSG